MFLPEGDRYSHSKEFLESKISSLFGGRIAEAMVFGQEKVTTGASNDIQKATELARNMVTKWGLSAKLGPLTFGEDEREVFLGHAVTRHKEISEITSGIIDQEVRDIIDRNYQRAEKILKEYLDQLHIMAEALIKYETISMDQIEDVMAGRTVREPVGWAADQIISAANKKAAAKESDESNFIKTNDNLKADSAHDQST
jgi:cell division protease FtsH